MTWSGAVAPRAHIKFVVSQSNFGDGVDASAAYIVDHNLAPVMSTSYGLCEQILGRFRTPSTTRSGSKLRRRVLHPSYLPATTAAQAAIRPAGTYATGVAVNGIASTPYNVAVGGTQFDDAANPSAYWNSTSDPVSLASALGYIPEMVWNESDNDPLNVYLWSGSGGVSTIYAKPSWQSAPGVPNDGKRDVPDISLTAALHDGYLVCLLGLVASANISTASAALPRRARRPRESWPGQPKDGRPTPRIGQLHLFTALHRFPAFITTSPSATIRCRISKGQYTVGYSATPGYDRASGTRFVRCERFGE